MARGADRYSRTIFWLKTLLPVMGVGILATLFLFSDRDKELDGPNLSRAQLDALAREEGIGTPRMTGVTSDGAAISLKASKTRPGNAERTLILGDDLSVNLGLPGGTTVNVTARNGQLNTQTRTGEVSGGAVLSTSTGYHATASRITFALDVTDVVAEGPIHGSGPLGTLEAGGMTLKGVPKEDNPDLSTYVLVFHSRVKLVYSPPK